MSHSDARKPPHADNSDAYAYFNSCDPSDMRENRDVSRLYDMTHISYISAISEYRMQDTCARNAFVRASGY